MIPQNNKTLNALAIYSFLALATVILLFPVLIKEASFCIHSDNRFQAYPFLNKLAASLHKGYLPLWDANAYGGKNFAGEFQTGIFYPVNLLWCYLFGSVNGIDVYYVDLLVVLHYFIGLLGMYKVARVLKLNVPAAIVTALIYTFAGTPGSRSSGQTCIFFGLTLLPWAVYFLCRYYMDSPKKKYLVFSGLACGVQILSGHIQPFFHAVLINGIIIIYFEYINRKNLKSFIQTIAVNNAIIIGVALIITIPQLYYALQYLSMSYRWVSADHPILLGEKVPMSVYAYKFIIKPENLLNFFSKQYSQPDDGNLLYIGILPVFLTLAFVIKKRSLKLSKQHSYFYAILSIVIITGLLASLGYLTIIHHVLYHIPLVTSIRELSRYAIMINFGTALLAGLAIHNLGSMQQTLFSGATKKWLYILLALAVNALYLVLFEKNDIPRQVSIPFLLGFSFFLILMRSKNLLLVYSLAVAFTFADLYLNPVSFSSVDSEFYPPRFFARNSIFNFLETTYGKYRVTFEMENDEMNRKNIGDIYNIQTKLGHCATMYRPYFDFICQGWELNSEVHDLFNIRYIIADKTLDSNFIFKDSAQGLKLYERKNYYPRIFWKTQLGLRGPMIEEQNKQTIKQTAYADQYQKIEVNCLAADTLIVSEINYPGWECYDNNKKIEIFSAHIKDYVPVLRSIALDKGYHVIEFRYKKVFHWF